MTTSIGVIGGGAWGTALAQSTASTGHTVTIWAREDDVVKTINQDHENKIFLPGVKLHDKITASGDLVKTAAAEILLIVTPAQHLRASLKSLPSEVLKGKPLVICAKGIELGTGKLLTDIIQEETPQAIPVILSGPTFAAEIARGLPSAVTIACRDEKTGLAVRDAVASRSIRPYYSDDLVGAQIGGAVKNVIAIACGIASGKKLGDSARAALVTRGLAEIARLTQAMGGRRETLMGLSGIGDLMLTCSSMQSRNFSLGFMLGEGRKLSDILGERMAVTEGVHTAAAVMKMAKDHKVDMPVSMAVFQCLHENMQVNDAIKLLLDRPLQNESL